VSRLTEPATSEPVRVEYTAPSVKPSVSVIVPAFNESSIILETLRSLVSYMHTLDDHYGWEIVVVDDGSTDGTGYLAQQMSTRDAHIRVLRHRVNFMLGQALRTAFNSCTTDYLVVIDCDLSYSAEHIGRLLETIETTQARVVIASPYMAGGRTTAVPFLRNLASRTANQILSIAASGRIRTLTGMVRAYDRRFIASLNLKAMGTEVNTEIIYKAQLLRARIEEIPGHLDWTVIENLPRRSTVRLANGTIRSLMSAFFFRPFAFFIAPGIITTVAALTTLGFAVGHPFEQARVTYLLGVFLAAGAIMLLSVGMLALQAKRYFEELFSLGTRLLREVRGESPTPANFLEDPKFLADPGRSPGSPSPPS
jgi:dolichol-phosphate mannosyltransferase